MRRDQIAADRRVVGVEAFYNRRRPALPVMKASPADAEYAAHHGDGIVRLLCGDQRVRLAYRPSSSLAKKTAFRKISRSIRSFAFSSRNR